MLCALSRFGQLSTVLIISSLVEAVVLMGGLDAAIGARDIEAVPQNRPYNGIIYLDVQGTYN